MDDIILSIAGTIGLVSLIPVNLNNAILTENCVKIIIKSQNLIGKFLLYYISSIKETYIKTLIVGNSIPKLSITKIKSIKIPLPPLETQNQLVSLYESKEKHLQQIDQKIQTETDYLQSLEDLGRDVITHYCGKC